MPNGESFKVRAKTLEELTPGQRASITRLVEGLNQGTLSLEGQATLQRIVQSNPDLFIGKLPPLRPLQPGVGLGTAQAFGQQPGAGSTLAIRQQPPPPPPRATPAELGGVIGATVGGIAGNVPGAALGGFGGSLIGGALEKGVGFTPLSELDPSTVVGPQERFARAAREGAIQGGLEAIFRGGGRLARRVRGPGGIERALGSPEVAMAERAGLELLPAQTGGSLTIAFQSVLERALGTQTAFKQFRLRQATRLNRFVNIFLDTASKSSLSRKELGVLVSNLLATTRREAGRVLGRVEDSLPNIQVRFSSKRAVRLRELTAESKRLQERVSPPGAPGAQRSLIAIAPDKPITIREAVQEARDLRRLGAGAPSQVKGTLRAARGELLDAIDDTLRGAGENAKANEFRAARGRVREIERAFEDRFIKNLAQGKRGEVVGAMLASRTGGISRAANIRRVLGIKDVTPLPREIRRGFLEELFEGAQTAVGDRSGQKIFVGNALEQRVAAIGEDTIREILTREEADFLLREIRPLANMLDLPASLTRPLSSESATLLAFGQTAGAGEAVRRGRLLTAISFIGVPVVLTNIITKRGGIQLLRDLAKTKRGTAEFLKLTLRLTAVALDEEAEQVPE